MKKFSKKLLVMLLALAMMFSFAACGSDEPAGGEGEGETAGDGSLQAVLDKGVMQIGAEGNWVPYVYHNEDGELVGFEVEMAKAIGEKLGVEVNHDIADSWDGVLAGLEADRYDVVICGAGPTPERQEKYEVARPYGEQVVALVARADDESIQGWEDLEGKVSANSLSSSSGNIARKYGAELVEASLEEAMMMINDGRADCQVNDAYAISMYIEKNPDKNLRIAAYYVPENQYEIQSAPIIKKGNVELCEAIDQAVAELIEDGTARELCVKYFGEDFAAGVSLY